MSKWVLLFLFQNRFPKDDGVKQKWLNAIGKRSVAKSATICSDHFSSDSFNRCNLLAKVRKLLPTAVPNNVESPNAALVDEKRNDNQNCQQIFNDNVIQLKDCINIDPQLINNSEDTSTFRNTSATNISEECASTIEVSTEPTKLTSNFMTHSDRIAESNDFEIQQKNCKNKNSELNNYNESLSNPQNTQASNTDLRSEISTESVKSTNLTTKKDNIGKDSDKNKKIIIYKDDCNGEIKKTNKRCIFN